MKITHLVLPESNKDDFEQLPESVRKGITAYFADTYEDVFKVAFEKSKVWIPYLYQINHINIHITKIKFEIYMK